jgi:hypothetical protein
VSRTTTIVNLLEEYKICLLAHLDYTRAPGFEKSLFEETFEASCIEGEDRETTMFNV